MWALVGFVVGLFIVAIVIGLILDVSARRAAERGELPPSHH